MKSIVSKPGFDRSTQFALLFQTYIVKAMSVQRANGDRHAKKVMLGKLPELRQIYDALNLDESRFQGLLGLLADIVETPISTDLSTASQDDTGTSNSVLHSSTDGLGELK